MEQTLIEELGKYFVFAFVVFKASQDICAFVDDAGVDPSGRKATEICSVTRVVLTFFFVLFLNEQYLPSGMDLVEDIEHQLEPVLGRIAIEL